MIRVQIMSAPESSSFILRSRTMFYRVKNLPSSPL